MSFKGPLSERIAIRELIETYNDAVARRDATAWAATWAEDCTWVVLGESHSGKDVIVSTWMSIMDRFPFVSLTAYPGMIRSDGVKAAARVHMTETLCDQAGVVAMSWSRYDDLLEQIAGQWLFTRRTYTVMRRTVLAAPQGSGGAGPGG